MRSCIFRELATVILFIICITLLIPYLVFSKFTARTIQAEIHNYVRTSIQRQLDYIEQESIAPEQLSDIYATNALVIQLMENMEDLELNEQQKTLLEAGEIVFTRYRSHPQRGLLFLAAVRYRGKLLVWEFHTSQAIFDRLRVSGLLSLVSSLLLGLICTLLATKHVIQPLQRLDAATQRVAAGDFDVRLPERGKDEISSLIRNFNVMTSKLGGVELLRNNFISDISHEFKTPLTAIEGYAKLLEGECSKEEQQEYLAIIQEEAGRLSTLAENILMLNRIEKGNITSKQQQVRLDEQIRRALTLCEGRWEQKDIQLQLSLEELTIQGYEALLMQVWTNLIDNAVKFSPQGGQVSIELFRQPSGRIVFVISDQGSGITPENVTHIFEKFYKADQSRKSDGNGLGLSIVKQVVQLHNGEIAVDSSCAGSTFTILF